MSRRNRNLLRVGTALMVLGGLLLAPPGPVWACSCAMPATPAIAVNDAAAVFTGAVTSIVDRGGFDFLDEILSALGQPRRASFGDARRVTLAVADSWKGVSTTPVTIGTGQGDADCGYNFSVGGQYLVYAHDNQGRLSTNICARTAELSQAQADLAYLQGQPTLTLRPAVSGAPAFCLAGVLVLLAGAGVAAWAWRRRARRALPA